MLRTATITSCHSSHNMSFFGSIKVKLGRKRNSTSRQQQTTEVERVSRQDTMNANNNTAGSSWNTTNASPNANPFSDPANAAPEKQPCELVPDPRYLSPTDNVPKVDAPPAYTSTPSAAGPSSLHPQSNNPFSSQRSPSPVPSIASVSTPEDKYAFLTTFDTIFVIDDSGSMAGRSWREVRDALRAITPICTAHDADGIDVYFLNHKSGEAGGPDKPSGGYNNIKDAEQVQRLFERVRPSGATPTGTRLQHILKPYVASLTRRPNNMESIKPVNIIVITDGCPTDDPESIIVHHAKKLDNLEAPPYQVGIQFFQVGNEPGATTALRELDDDLADQGIRDMVDTVTWDSKTGRSQELTADGILKVVLGAVVRRLDRKAVVGGVPSRR